MAKSNLFEWEYLFGLWFNCPSSFKLAQAIFYSLYKNIQCSPQRERKFFLLVELHRWDYWASIDMNKSSKYIKM